MDPFAIRRFLALRHSSRFFNDRAAAFIVLIDRSACGSRTNRPLRIVAVNTFFRKGISAAGALELETIFKLGRACHLNIVDRYGIKALRNRKHFVTSGNNFCEESAVGRRGDLLKKLRCSSAKDRHCGVGDRVAALITNKTANYSESVRIAGKSHTRCGADLQRRTHDKGRDNKKCRNVMFREIFHSANTNTERRVSFTKLRAVRWLCEYSSEKLFRATLIFS